MTKFTPGPWTTQQWGGERLVQAFVEDGPGRSRVLEIAKIVDRENRIPNTRLITSAPELFEELKELVAIVGWKDPRTLRAIELMGNIEREA